MFLIKNKEHLTRKGFLKILTIRASINKGLSDELNLSYPNIKPAPRPVFLVKNIKNYNWIAGLASGDGCFHISIRNSLTTKLRKSIVLKFHIAQHSRDIKTIEMIISNLGCGKVELVLKQSAVYFVVVKFEDIVKKVIPLFDKYPIKGVKALDYNDFKKVVNILACAACFREAKQKTKQHLTEQGLLKIKDIKQEMNSFRKINKYI